ncbi:DUF6232 family protein [Streptomyces sp. NPDC127112]|uniref:DUF6232 family protein n=1 Tax=Streptomyces sp. NPDC127112 TaxID=3345364 RepID=UPI00363CA118
MAVMGNAGAPPSSGPLPQLSVPPPFVPPDELMGSLSRGRLVLRVSGRMLWLGSKAVPLHNIASVDAFKVKPDWGTALLRVLKWLFSGAVLIVATGLVDWLVTGTEVSIGGGGIRLLLTVVVVAATALAGAFRAARPVLAVETAGGSILAVTLPSIDELRQIAGRIVYAINYPDAEFTVVVKQFNTTRNHAPGAILNGGQGNTRIML